MVRNTRNTGEQDGGPHNKTQEDITIDKQEKKT